MQSVMSPHLMAGYYDQPSLVKKAKRRDSRGDAASIVTCVRRHPCGEAAVGGARTVERAGEAG
jgi:hypothetical protein